MKKLTLMLVLAMIVSLTFAQKVVGDKEIPSAVKDEFKKRYPNINMNTVKWEKELNDYRASFDNANTHYVAEFKEDGAFNRSRAKVRDNEVPRKMRDYADKNHPDDKYKEVEKIIDTDGKVSYNMKIKDKEHSFDHNGNFIMTKEKVHVKDKEKVEKRK